MNENEDENEFIYIIHQCYYDTSDYTNQEYAYKSLESAIKSLSYLYDISYEDHRKHTLEEVENILRDKLDYNYNGMQNEYKNL